VMRVMRAWGGREGRESGGVRTSGGYAGGGRTRRGAPRIEGCGCNYLPCVALALYV